MKELTAVSTSPVEFFISKVRDVLGRSGAVLPLDHRLPDGPARRLLGRMRPGRVLTPEGERELAGEPVDDRVGFVVPTSGTTGDPKGVELSASALDSSARATYSRLGLDPTDRWLLCLPPAHVAGLSVITRSHLHGADPVVLDPFDPERAVELGEGLVVSLVPTMLRSILEVTRELPFKMVLLGGGPVPQGLIDAAHPTRVVATYGMTETCGGCVYDGVPLDGVGVRIGSGSVIEVSGPTLMERYRLDPGATRDAMVDGWFRTADVGTMSGSGLLEVWGRADDMIITGGQKVSPVLVEAALREHPDVVDAAVVGRADEKWGEAVVAVVVGGVGLEEVKTFLRGRLPDYCLPKVVVDVPAIPRTATDKIDRSALRRIAG